MIVDDDWWENETNTRTANIRRQARLRNADLYLLKAIGEESPARKLQFIGLALEMIDAAVDSWPAPKVGERVDR